MVIVMLRELDMDIWQKCTATAQIGNHWTEDAEESWKRQVIPVSKKKNGKLTMRGNRPIALQPILFRKYSKTLQQLAGGALQ